MPRKNNTPPHQPYEFHNPCDGKRRYASEREALAAAEHQMLLKPTLELSVYQCQWCGKWHLTRSQRQ